MGLIDAIPEPRICSVADAAAERMPSNMHDCRSAVRIGLVRAAELRFHDGIPLATINRGGSLTRMESRAYIAEGGGGVLL
ncbi:MAG: hypothetical protein QM784_08425 [Polyangiaceae bacterium]